MKRKELRKILLQEKEKFSTKSYKELRLSTEPIVYELNYKGMSYQVEVQLIEKNDDYISVSMSIDDKSLFGAMFPVSINFIVNN